MRHTALRGVLLALLGTILVLGVVGTPAAAQAPEPAPTAAAQVDGEHVSELPATGRGHGLEASDTERFAAEQMLGTVLVLVATGTLALGVIALAWRHDRQ